MTTHDHDLSKRPEAAGMNGKELLQAMIDGRLPGPAIGKTLSCSKANPARTCLIRPARFTAVGRSR
jgi:hypothetical protein